MGIKIREFIGLCADIVGLWAFFGASLSAVLIGYWSNLKSLPAPLTFFIGLGSFCLFLGVTAFIRFHASFEVLDMWEGTDSALPGVLWQIRVGRTWDGPGRGRRILGACAKCLTGLGDSEEGAMNCHTCRETLATHELYSEVMKRVLAQKKFVWENGKAGFKKVKNSERAT
ncbi:MAG: hypothetical protein ABL962_16730 [Fimbriimonadaceae bacterium]|jgi:hypothetical protein